MRCTRSIAASPSHRVTSEPIRMPANIPKLTPVLCWRDGPEACILIALALAYFDWHVLAGVQRYIFGVYVATIRPR